MERSTDRVTLPAMNAIITRNGELLIAIVATIIALVGAFAHVSEPIERAASHSRN